MHFLAVGLPQNISIEFLAVEIYFVVLCCLSEGRIYRTPFGHCFRVEKCQLVRPVMN